MRRRQLRAMLSPLGVHASLPASHSEAFLHATLRTRSSPVSSRTEDADCLAAGGALHARIGKDVEVTATELTPGTPVTVSSVSVPGLVCIGMKRVDVLLRDWAGWGVNRDVEGAKRPMRTAAQAVRSALLST